MKSGMHIALWIVQILLALVFVAAAYYHGGLPIATAAKYAPWIPDLPVWLVKFIACAELAGGLGLILPSALRVRPDLTPLAALGLTVMMVLSVGFHLARGEFHIVAFPFTLGCLAAFVAWGRFRLAPIAPR